MMTGASSPPEAIANGFTLIELLAAMLVGSLLLVTLSWLTGSLGREARQSDDARATAQIASIAPTIDRLARSTLLKKDDASLDVGARTLSADIIAPAALGGTGPLHMMLTAKRQQDGDALVMTFAPVTAGATISPVAQKPVALATGFRSIRFETDADDSSENDIDAGVARIIFVDARNVSRSLTFAPRINASGICQFDPVSLACR